jgi:hypothetical protein
MRQSLLQTREHVWRAYFTNEKPYLEQVLPAELVAIDPGNDKFSTRESILAGAQSFAQSGAKLIKIEFPTTAIQMYGRVAEIYSSFALEFESPNGTRRESGHATETFIFRDGKWLNVGWHLDAAPTTSAAGSTKSDSH